MGIIRKKSRVVQFVGGAMGMAACLSPLAALKAQEEGGIPEAPAALEAAPAPAAPAAPVSAPSPPPAESTLGETIVTAQPAPTPAPRPRRSAPAVTAPRPNVSNQAIIINDDAPDVIVGERVQRESLDTVNSFVVFSGEDLATRNISSIEEVLNRTPGANNVGSGQGFSIRGVQGVGATNSGNRFSPTIAVLKDGVSLDRFDQRLDPQQLWDVKQVEVLRGGQSTNLGKSSLAGAIILQSNDPTDEFELNLEQGFESFGGNYTFGTVNIPVSEGVALRFSGGYSADDGNIDNPTIGITEDSAEMSFFRAKLLIDNGSNLRMLSTYSFNDTFNGDDFVAAADPSARQIFSNLAGFEQSQYSTFSHEIDWTINDAWSLDSRFTWYDSAYDRQDDADRTPGGGTNGFNFRKEWVEEYTGEVRLRFDDEGPLRFQVGSYYSDRQIEESFGTDGFDVTPLALFNVFSNIPSAVRPFVAPGGVTDPFVIATASSILGSPPPYLLVLDTQSQAGFTNYAFFGELEYDFTDQLMLRAGLRYDVVENNQNTSTVANLPLLPSGQDADATQLDALLPSASLHYRINDDMSIAALYKKAYRTGGVEIDLGGQAAGKATNTFDPEFTDTFELAFRAENVGDFDFSANVYYTKWKDQQVGIDPTGAGLTFTQNAGESTQYGFEGLVEYTPSDRLQIYGGVALAHTQYDVFNNGTLSFAGNEFTYAPEVMVSGGFTYAITEELFFNLNGNYQSESFVDPQNTVINDARTIFNASLTYDKGDWYASLYANNLFDELYLTRNNGAGAAVQVGNAQIIGVKAGVRF